MPVTFSLKSLQLWQLFLNQQKNSDTHIRFVKIIFFIVCQFLCKLRRNNEKCFSFVHCYMRSNGYSLPLHRHKNVYQFVVTVTEATRKLNRILVTATEAAIKSSSYSFPLRSGPESLQRVTLSLNKVNNEHLKIHLCNSPICPVTNSLRVGRQTALVGRQ
jgi:hypothetical protein